jgi:hypothetical protein
VASERNFFGVIFPSDDCCVCLFSCVSQCVCVCKVILLFFFEGARLYKGISFVYLTLSLLHTLTTRLFVFVCYQIFC